MVHPLAALYGGAKIGGHINQMYRSFSTFRENERWWSDYAKNTGGLGPKYPWRQGAKNDWVGATLGTAQGVSGGAFAIAGQPGYTPAPPGSVDFNHMYG